MTSKEIICLHIGQAGIQIGNAFWELLRFEHELTEDGNLICFCPSPLNDNTGSLYGEYKNGLFKPRALLIDSESMVIDDVKSGIGSRMFHQSSFINGLESAGHLFPKGYNSCANAVLTRVTDGIQAQLDKTSLLNGFMMFHSMIGGTGSGLTAKISEIIKELAPKNPILNFAISPPTEHVEFIVDPYNAILSIASLTESSSLALQFENSALYRHCTKETKCNIIGFPNINRKISQIISSLTTSYRFNNVLSSDFSIYQTNLVPFPGLHFPVSSYASSEYVSTQNLIEITKQCFHSKNLTLNLTAEESCVFSSCCLYRGAGCGPLAINNALKAVKDDPSIHFVDWSPSAFKVAITTQVPGYVPGVNEECNDRSVCVISNTSGINQIWKKFLDRFQLLFDKKVFLHWYKIEGMEEEAFKLAREKVQDLVNQYEKLGSSCKIINPITESTNKVKKTDSVPKISVKSTTNNAVSGNDPLSDKVKKTNTLSKINTQSTINSPISGNDAHSDKVKKTDTLSKINTQSTINSAISGNDAHSDKVKRTDTLSKINTQSTIDNATSGNDASVDKVEVGTQSKTNAESTTNNAISGNDASVDKVEIGTMSKTNTESTTDNAISGNVTPVYEVKNTTDTEIKINNEDTTNNAMNRNDVFNIGVKHDSETESITESTITFTDSQSTIFMDKISGKVTTVLPTFSNNKSIFKSFTAESNDTSNLRSSKSSIFKRFYSRKQIMQTGNNALSKSANSTLSDFNSIISTSSLDSFTLTNSKNNFLTSLKKSIENISQLSSDGARSKSYGVPEEARKFLAQFKHTKSQFKFESICGDDSHSSSKYISINKVQAQLIHQAAELSTEFPVDFSFADLNLSHQNSVEENVPNLICTNDVLHQCAKKALLAPTFLTSQQISLIHNVFNDVKSAKPDFIRRVLSFIKKVKKHKDLKIKNFGSKRFPQPLVETGSSSEVVSTAVNSSKNTDEDIISMYVDSLIDDIWRI